MRFRVTYHRARDLARDRDQQMRKGGLLVRVLDGPAVARTEEVELELVTPAGRVTVPARMLQELPGAGLALGFETSAELEKLLDESQSARDTADRDPQHEAVSQTGGAAAGPPVDAHTKLREASHHEKMQIAMRGKRNERALIIRDPTAKSLHPYVLKNPKLQLDEVVAIAGLRTVSVDTLKLIAARREWAMRPEVAAALVRNPKTPVPIALRLVPHLSSSDLRAMAKQSNLRGPIQRAVRKKVVS